MAVITFPAGLRLPSEFSLDLFNQQYASGSGETLAGQIVETLGVPWVCRMTWQQFAPADADLLQAFLDRMQGYKNLTQLYNVLRPQPKGTATGAPLTNGVSTGLTLALKGMSPGQTLVPGDMLGRANLLYRVTVGATVDGSGNCSVSVVPPIVVPTANNEVVTLIKPTAYFRLRTNFNPTSRAIPLQAGWLNGMTLEFIEALP